jgi:enamine deaminase RidA (YjgF/YER057c/UK114 family)
VTALADLKRLDYELPKLPTGQTPYASYWQAGSAVHIAGQLPFLDSAVPLRGQLGRDVRLEVLGDNGRHARTTVGVAGLPRDSPVEIQAICTAVQAGS